jgi:hypothetical protein
MPTNHTGFRRIVPSSYNGPARAHRLVSAVAACLGALALTACDSGATGTDVDLGQVYELTSVSGEALPFDQGNFTILSGTLILGSDGSCQRTQRVGIESPDASGVINNDWTCSWTEVDGAVEVTWDLIGVPDLQSGGTKIEDTVTLDVPIVLVCVAGPCSEPWTEIYVEVTS